HQDNLFVWLLQYAAIRGADGFRSVWSGRKVEFNVRPSPDEIGRLSDIQLSTTERLLFQIPIHRFAKNGSDGLLVDCRVEIEHSRYQGSNPRRRRKVWRQLPHGGRPDKAELLQIQLLPHPLGLRLCRSHLGLRSWLDDRQQGLHLSLLQQTELQRSAQALGHERRRQTEQLSQVRRFDSGDSNVEVRNSQNGSLVRVR